MFIQNVHVTLIWTQEPFQNICHAPLPGLKLAGDRNIIL